MLISWCIFGFSFALAGLWCFQEILLYAKWPLPGGVIMLADWADLFLGVPIYVIGFWCLYRAVKRNPAGSVQLWMETLLWKILAVFGVAYFFTAFGMHLSTNALERLAEYNNIAEPSPLFDVRYFFDEILSHKIQFNAFFLLLFLISALQINRPLPEGSGNKPKTIAIITGAALAPFLCCMCLEGNGPVIGIVWGLILFLFGLWELKRELAEPDRLPGVVWTMTLGLIQAVILTAWGIALRGFPPPSHFVHTWLGY